MIPWIKVDISLVCKVTAKFLVCCCSAGLLNPLACPHHMSQSEEAEYREGVVLNKPVKEGRGSFVNVGLQKEVRIDRHLDAGLRVTIKMKSYVEGMSSSN